jgi:RNA polymerase sigma-B factor
VRVPRTENGDGSRRRETFAVPLDEDALAAPDALAATEDRLLVASLVRRLGTREREVVYRYFVRERSQADIGRELGLSQIQVSRMLRASLAVMRRRLEALPR